MSLQSDIKANFLDADGLVSPHPCLNTDHNASNNGVMYLGEYITLLKLSNQLEQTDVFDFLVVIKNCYAAIGCLKRSPSNNTDTESVDDYYSFLAACYFSKSKISAQLCLAYGKQNYGSYYNLDPGHFQWSTFLFRQPQLVAMMYWASGYKCPKLLEWYTALIILTSCMFKKQSDGADLWRLSWLLIQVAKRESKLCNWASKFWYNRLGKVWCSMGFVYAKYYKGIPNNQHPFTTAMFQLGE
jgi:hypothetical protein